MKPLLTMKPLAEHVLSMLDSGKPLEKAVDRLTRSMGGKLYHRSRIAWESVRDGGDISEFRDALIDDFGLTADPKPARKKVATREGSG